MSKEKIEVDTKNVLEAYHNANKTTKNLLEKLYGKELFIQPSSDWMKIWNIFCKENNLKVVLPHAKPKNSDEEWLNSCEMLRNIFKIRRGNWKPNYKDNNQPKWFPIFTLSSSGFVFSLSGTIIWDSITNVGSRLCLPTEKMSNDIAKEFLPIFEKFHMNLQ